MTMFLIYNADNCLAVDFVDQELIPPLELFATHLVLLFFFLSGLQKSLRLRRFNSD